MELMHRITRSAYQPRLFAKRHLTNSALRSRQQKPFNSEHPKEIDRACGVPFRSSEAGPGRFDSILLVLGNHEFYGSSREAGLAAAERLMNEPSMHGKLHLLNRRRFDVPGSNVTILGCTLHSHIADGYTRLTNDFQRIENWTVKRHNAEHRTDLAWLKQSLLDIRQDKSGRSVVVVTHYAPMFDRVPPKEREQRSQPVLQ